jgi:DNA (cytosine-5)-methyltransferase 1
VRFIELFGGIGGFRYGLEATEGYECVWYCDIDEHATAIYNINFNENYEPSDAQSVEPKDIPDFDLLTAGFPCQSFSIAGKRKGFDDERGNLFYEIVRIVSERKPRYILLENVPGILSNDGGRTYATILDTLSELGYRIQWQVLNSKDFGVPQSRKRPFVVGSPRGECPPKVFPIGHGETISYQEIDREQREGLELQGQVVPTIRGTYHKGYESTGPLISPTIDARYGALRDSGEPYIADFRYDEGLRPRKDGNSPTLFDAAKGGGLSNELFVLDAFNQNERRDGLAGTLKGEGVSESSVGTALMLRDGRDNRSCLRSGRTTEVGIEGMSIRRLTPTECERLQGFPDGWTMFGSLNGTTYEVSDTPRYKLLGNAVTTNVVTAIGRILARAIKEDYD